MLASPASARPNQEIVAADVRRLSSILIFERREIDCYDFAFSRLDDPFMKEFALITGATAGIGYELAKLFAANHFNLALVARDEARLKNVADELRAAHNIETIVLPKDLSNSAAPREILDALRDTPVSVLVNNAGFGSQGAFAEEKLELSLNMMHVNMDALVQLTHLFLEPMLKRQSGRILNVASTAAFQPGPFTNIYYATKAFVFSFSVALAEELAGTGITVTTLCPGFTKTEFHERAGFQRSSRWLPMMSAQDVAQIGFRGLMNGKRIVIPGVRNKLTAAVSRRLPATFTAKIVRRMNAE
jgi:short-subunit dehydrogenase